MKIVIAGYGLEGKSNLTYFRHKFPEAEFVVADAREVVGVPEGVVVQSGEGVFSRLDDADMVVRTAGLPPRSITTNGKIWSATNEFFAECPAPIIGVTGTKGKGTTCSLIAAILRASGQTVHLVGNIGTPALDILPSIHSGDTVVYEMSSFQLWDAQMSPRIAVVLMIEPDHLDVHTDMDEYVAAKANIIRHQSVNDTALYHPTNTYAAAVVEGVSSHAVRYAIPDDRQVYVKDNTFFVRGTPICSADALQLPGMFNRENACAAISAALAAGGSIDAVEAGLREFTGLPHRLKFVREINGVRYFDDSIATTPGSAIAALSAFSGPKVIILGGSDKGADYRGVAEACRGATTVIAVGQTGERIARLCEEYGVAVKRETGGMKSIVQSAQSVAVDGGVVILSPASASFDQYKSYVDRGEQFVAAVKEL